MFRLYLLNRPSSREPSTLNMRGIAVAFATLFFSNFFVGEILAQSPKISLSQIRTVSDTTERAALLSQYSSSSVGVTRATVLLELAELSWLLKDANRAQSVIDEIDLSVLDRDARIRKSTLQNAIRIYNKK